MSDTRIVETVELSNGRRVTLVIKPGEYATEVDAYEVAGEYVHNGALIYEAEDGQMVGTLAEAHPGVRAYIKWDGCSTWDFEEAAHICGYDDLARHTETLQAIFKAGARHTAHFDAETAGYPQRQVAS